MRLVCHLNGILRLGLFLYELGASLVGDFEAEGRALVVVHRKVFAAREDAEGALGPECAAHHPLAVAFEVSQVAAGIPPAAGADAGQ